MLLDERAVRLLIDADMEDGQAVLLVGAFYALLSEAVVSINDELRANFGRSDIRLEVNGFG